MLQLEDVIGKIDEGRMGIETASLNDRVLCRWSKVPEPEVPLMQRLSHNSDNLLKGTRLDTICVFYNGESLLL